MAVELSVAKGSLKATAEELGITPQILTRWPSERVVAQGSPAVSRTPISQEQEEIVRLEKELKQAELDRIDFYDSGNSWGIKILAQFGFQVVD